MNATPEQPDPPTLHRNRARAESFGAVAAQYDRARPGYPDALVVDLLARGGRTVLDVGCGTGKAARQLAARGASVLGVEPDAQMAEVARAHGIEVEVGAFETWPDHGRRFDLVISAQAWHWVDPDAGARKARQVLRPGGVLGLFWNLDRLDADVRRVLDDVYRREAPALLESQRRNDAQRGRGPEYLPSLAAAGFEDVVVRRYPWQRTYTRDEWLDLLPTYSDHQLLPDDRRARLLDAMGAAVDALGGTVTSYYETHTVLARAPR